MTRNKIHIIVIWYQKIHHVLLCCVVGAKYVEMWLLALKSSKTNSLLQPSQKLCSVESHYFDDILKHFGYCFDTWCYHVNWKANKRLKIKCLVALVCDEHCGFYRKACIKYSCSLLYSFVSVWSNRLVVIGSCDPYFLPNSANNFCSIFRLSLCTNRLIMFIRGWYAIIQAKVKRLNESLW